MTLCVRSLAALMLVLATFTPARSQPRHVTVGKEFWLGFPPDGGGEFPPTSNAFTLALVGDHSAKVVITIDALAFRDTVNLLPGSSVQVELPNGNDSTLSVEDTSIDRVSPGMAVHIIADSDIGVFALSHKLNSTDAYLAYPSEVYGKFYVAASYQNSTGQFPTTPGQLLVLGTKNGTNITITPRCNLLGVHPAGVPYTIQLNVGDAYLIQADVDAVRDLTGTMLRSDQPVVVLSGHDRTQMPEEAVAPGGVVTRNELLEELLPVDLWDSSAIVIPLLDEPSRSLVRIIAAYDNTQLLIRKAFSPDTYDTLDAGFFNEIHELQQAYYISATRPIEVMQYLHSSDPTGTALSDPSMMSAVSINHMDTSLAIFAWSDSGIFQKNYVNAIIRGDAPLFLDGNRLDTAQVVSVPVGEYNARSFRITPGVHQIRSSDPFSVQVYGMGQVDAYACGGGLSISSLPAVQSVARQSVVSEDIRLYPNPFGRTVSPVLHLELPTNAKVVGVRLVSPMGQYVVVGSQPEDPGALEIPKSVTAGCYILEVRLFDGSAVRKLLIVE